MIPAVVVKKGCSFLPQATNAARPPGFSTRKHSRNALARSGKNITPKRQVRTSKDSPGNGRDSALASRNSMLVMPFLRASSSAREIIPGPRSVAVTRPVGATSAAMESAGSPTPLARSRTRMPGRRWAASRMASVAPRVNAAIWACHLRQAATVLSPVHSW